MMLSATTRRSLAIKTSSIERSEKPEVEIAFRTVLDIIAWTMHRDRSLDPFRVETRVENMENGTPVLFDGRSINDRDCDISTLDRSGCEFVEEAHVKQLHLDSLMESAASSDAGRVRVLVS